MWYCSKVHFPYREWASKKKWAADERFSSAIRCPAIGFASSECGRWLRRRFEDHQEYLECRSKSFWDSSKIRSERSSTQKRMLTPASWIEHPTSPPESQKSKTLTQSLDKRLGILFLERTLSAQFEIVTYFTRATRKIYWRYRFERSRVFIDCTIRPLARDELGDFIYIVRGVVVVVIVVMGLDSKCWKILTLDWGENRIRTWPTQATTIARKTIYCYKVSDEPRAQPEDWENFSGAAYEIARVERWRWYDTIAFWLLELSIQNSTSNVSRLNCTITKVMYQKRETKLSKHAKKGSDRNVCKPMPPSTPNVPAVKRMQRCKQQRSHVCPGYPNFPLYPEFRQRKILYRYGALHAFPPVPCYYIFCLPFSVPSPKCHEITSISFYSRTRPCRFVFGMPLDRS